MKKYISLLIIGFSFSATAQNIIINGTDVDVSQDVSFPYWLDSMATIEIGSQVVSISALEFNIVPTNNGNNLVFIQTKNITSNETVPNGKTWKIEAVFLDSTVSNTTNSSTSSITTTNIIGFSLGLGVHSPDTLKFWRVDAINLKNDPASYPSTGNYTDCSLVGGSYPYSKCNYSIPSTVNILQIGELNVNISGVDYGSFNNGSGDNCSSVPCPATYPFSMGFSNTDFDKLNFPIYISSDEDISILSSDIILSVTEFTVNNE